MATKDFTENSLFPLLDDISTERKFSFLMEDFNINMSCWNLPWNVPLRLQPFCLIILCNTLCSYFFAPLILRVTEKSKVLTENIFFNSFEFKTHSGNIVHKILDQLYQFIFFFFWRFSLLYLFENVTLLNKISKNLIIKDLKMNLKSFPTLTSLMKMKTLILFFKSFMII